MPLNKNAKLGKVKITDNAIASLTGTIVNECFGVVGMTSKSPIVDGYNTLLKKENYSKGVIVRVKNSELIIDLFVVVQYGLKLTEVVNSIQERVKYTLEDSLNMDVKEVNVHIEGVKVNE